MELLQKFLKCFTLAVCLLTLAAAIVWNFFPSAGWVTNLAYEVLSRFAENVCLVALLLLVTALGWVFPRVIRSRFPPGHCQTCGYNLTGNTSGRCPECGQPLDGTSNHVQS
jgi:hypothetical protein